MIILIELNQPWVWGGESGFLICVSWDSVQLCNNHVHTYDMALGVNLSRGQRVLGGIYLTYNLEEHFLKIWAVLFEIKYSREPCHILQQAPFLELST